MAILRYASKAIVLIGFHIGYQIESPVKIRSAEKPGTRVDELATRYPIRKENRYKLIYRYVIPCCEFGGFGIKIFGDSDTSRHILSSSIVPRNSRGVTTAIPKRSAPAKCLTLWVTMALARPATASSSRNSSPGSGRNGRSRK